MKTSTSSIKYHYISVLISIIMCSYTYSNALEHKCGTFESASYKDFQAIWARGESILASRPVISPEENTIVSPSGKFLIHYTKYGNDRVDSTDKNHNSIPDYIDSVCYYFDEVYSYEVNTLGYPAPPSDQNGGGSEAYDIYVRNMKEMGYYGLTEQETRVASTNSQPKATSFISIDNNYGLSANGNKIYNTSGIDALKITAAHEFHHAIQFGCYGVNDKGFDLALYEMYSTWMEYLQYPAVKDYINYAKSLFTNPQEYRFGRRGPSDIYTGYAWGIFFEFLHHKFGISASKEMWDNIGKGDLPFRALELSLNTKSSSLNDIWCELSQWMYHTGSKSYGISDANKFMDAEDLPEMKAITDSANPSLLFSQSIYPYEFRLFTCVLPNNQTIADTADFMCSIVSPNPFYNLSTNQNPLVFSVSKQITQNAISSTGYYWNFDTKGMQNCSNAVLSKGIAVKPNQVVYPNPYILHQTQELMFPLPAMVNEGEMALLTIYTTTGKLIYSDNLLIEIDPKNKANPGYNTLVIKYLQADTLERGVYIFSVEYKGKTIHGKFLVK